MLTAILTHVGVFAAGVLTGPIIKVLINRVK